MRQTTECRVLAFLCLKPPGWVCYATFVLSHLHFQERMMHSLLHPPPTTPVFVVVQTQETLSEVWPVLLICVCVMNRFYSIAALQELHPVS